MRALLPIALLLAPIIAASGTPTIRETAEAATRGAPRILYASDWTGHMQIYAVDPTGRAPLGQLTFGSEPGCRERLLPCGFVDPVPSPDGRYVLYRSATSVWRRRSGSLAPTEEIAAASTWTSRSQILHGLRFRGGIAYTGRDGLHVVRVDGTQGRVVSPEVLWDDAWSPDGRSFAGLRDGNLYLLRNGTATLLRRDAGEGLAWSPNGRWDRDVVVWAGHEIRLTDTAGRPGPRVGVGVLAAWSPDGRRLAFEAPEGLRVLDLRTWRVHPLTRETAHQSRAWGAQTRSSVLNIAGWRPGGLGAPVPSGLTTAIHATILPSRCSAAT